MVRAFGKWPAGSFWIWIEPADREGGQWWIAGVRSDLSLKSGRSQAKASEDQNDRRRDFRSGRATIPDRRVAALCSCSSASASRIGSIRSDGLQISSPRRVLAPRRILQIALCFFFSIPQRTPSKGRPDCRIPHDPSHPSVVSSVKISRMF